MNRDKVALQVEFSPNSWLHSLWLTYIAANLTDLTHTEIQYWYIARGSKVFQRRQTMEEPN